MELVDAASNLVSNEVAKCLPSATVGVDASCNVYITTTASDNAYVESMWTTTAAGIDTYKEFKLCPAASTANVTAANDADVPAAFLLALNSYVYGLNSARDTALKSSNYGAITFTHPGRVVIRYSTGPDTLVYAIRAITGTPATAFGADAVIVTTSTGFGAGQVNTTHLGLPCDAGRYGLQISNSVKLCAVCPAGTTGVGGFSCKACAAGSASSSVLFSGTCTQCSAGTYAPEGKCRHNPCAWLAAAHHAPGMREAPAAAFAAPWSPYPTHHGTHPLLDLQVAPPACPAPPTPTRLPTRASARPGECLLLAASWREGGQLLGCLCHFFTTPRKHQPPWPPSVDPATLPPPCPASPEDTYAWLPGSTECVRCAAGVAYAHTASSPPAASEGGAA